MKLASGSTSFLSVLVLAGCQATVNLGPVSATDGVDTSSGTENGSATQAASTDSSGSTAQEPSTGAQTTGSASTGSETSETSGSTTGNVGTDSTGGTSNNTTDASSTSMNTGETTSTSGPMTSTGTDSDSGEPLSGCEAPWTRVRTVVITNEPRKPLNDFQVYLKVEYDDDMKFDFSDLRFFDSMGAALPYWIESSTVPVEARVWVRVPAIPAAAQTEIAMCYGNPAAAAESDPEATFIFFDGFDGDKLDTEVWETSVTPVLADGKVKITQAPVYSKLPPAQFPNMLVEAKADDSGLLMVGATQQGGNPVIYNHWSGDYGGTNKDGMQVLNGKFIDMFVSNGIIGAAADEGNIYVTRHRLQRFSGTGGWKSPLFVGLGGLKSNIPPQYPLNVDWVLIRRFSSVEPTTEIGPEANL